MGKPNLPPGVTGGTTTAPEKNIWEATAPEIIVGKLDRVEGSQFSDLAVFPAAFLFTPGYEYTSGPRFLKLPISTLLEGLITPEHSGRYCLVEFEGMGVAKGKNSAPKLFKGVTTFAPGSAEEKQLKEFLHRVYVNQQNLGDPLARQLDLTAPLSDNSDNLPF